MRDGELIITQFIVKKNILQFYSDYLVFRRGGVGLPRTRGQADCPHVRQGCRSGLDPVTQQAAKLLDKKTNPATKPLDKKTKLATKPLDKKTKLATKSPAKKPIQQPRF